MTPACPLHADAAREGRAGQVQASAEQVRALCALLGALLEAPALRQGALIVLAVSCELVPRLWFSHLKVLLLSPTSTLITMSL